MDATTTSRPASSACSRWKSKSSQVPVQLRISAGGTTTTERVLLGERETRLQLPHKVDAVLVNAGGHGFYRVRYSPELRGRLLQHGLADLEPV